MDVTTDTDPFHTSCEVDITKANRISSENSHQRLVSAPYFPKNQIQPSIRDRSDDLTNLLPLLPAYTYLPFGEERSRWVGPLLSAASAVPPPGSSPVHLSDSPANGPEGASDGSSSIRLVPLRQLCRDNMLRSVKCEQYLSVRCEIITNNI